MSAAPEEVALPPVVEGIDVTEDILAAKRRNGAYYAEDVWNIVREYVTAHVYSTPCCNLEEAATRLGPLVSATAECSVVDSSGRFDGIHHAAELVQAWSETVHLARTHSLLHVVRRTPENSGALLMVQRLEHLRGQCEEKEPLALVLLWRDQQRLYLRSEVGDDAWLDAEVAGLLASSAFCPVCGDFLHLSKTTPFRCGHVAHTSCYTRLLSISSPPSCPSCRRDEDERPPVQTAPILVNIPENKYKDQVRILEALIEELQVEEEAPPSAKSEP